MEIVINDHEFKKSKFKKIMNHKILIKIFRILQLKFLNNKLLMLHYYN